LFRFLLRAPHPQLPEAVHCPGCNIELNAVDFNGHVAGCARCRGYNASSRHAGMKMLLHELLDQLGISHDDQEPRELKDYRCPGCHVRLKGDDIEAHPQECPKVRDGTTAKACGSGPDGRLYLPQGKSDRPRVIVWDITIVSTTAPSHEEHSFEQAFAAVTKKKVALYEARILAQNPGQEFLVIGGSALGKLSESTTTLVKSLVAASNSGLSADYVCKKLQAGLAFCSGHVIAEAERRVGIVHTPSPLQITQSATGRKGTVGASIASSDDVLW
jgi:hypothetical protein